MNHYEEQGDEDWWLPDLAQDVNLSRDVEIPDLEYHHPLKQEEEEEEGITDWTFVSEHESLGCRFPALVHVLPRRSPLELTLKQKNTPSPLPSIVEVISPPQEHESLGCRFPTSINVWYERLPFDSSNHLEQETASSRSVVEVRVTPSSSPPQEQQLHHELAHHSNSSKNRKRKQRRQQRNQKQACRVYANQSRPLPRKCRSMF